MYVFDCVQCEGSLNIIIQLHCRIIHVAMHMYHIQKENVFHLLLGAVYTVDTLFSLSLISNVYLSLFLENDRSTIDLIVSSVRISQ